MKMTRTELKNSEFWKNTGIVLPSYDVETITIKAKNEPRWVHFGIGNIFRIFLGSIADGMLENGDLDCGLTCIETFDFDIIDKIYEPFDNLALAVILNGDGTRDNKVLGCFAEAIKAQSSDAQKWNRMKQIFSSKSLQMISFTITEKGYALRDSEGKILSYVASDMEKGPEAVAGAMGIVTAMLWERYQNGAYPLALVSMDNCSHNGDLLRASVTEMAEEWEKRGFVTKEFVAYVEDQDKVSFPWTMIDKITPRPSEEIAQDLKNAGIEGLDPVVTGKRTYIAPFINAEKPQYLVIEDDFPNGRPPLEKAGVYFGSRDVVNKSEAMKVTTCLNPLHTAMSVYGCMLGHHLICDEMKDPDIVKLIETLGYQEGLPVVEDPGILSPKAFIDEVVRQRLPNPFLPDTPQRIATDTSQKIPIRFGETLKKYHAAGKDLCKLTAIPLALAGWLRYLLAVDDDLNPMELSPDPLLEELRGALAGIRVGDSGSCGDKLRPILSSSAIFGLNLVEAGLAPKVEELFRQELAGAGAVRRTLHTQLFG